MWCSGPWWGPSPGTCITWYYGIPSSSSHALIGGIVGAVIAKAGASALVSAGILKTVAFIFVSPLLGLCSGSLMMVVVAWLFPRSTAVQGGRWFRRLQLVSAGAYSLGHGGNDAQKTIGIIWMLLIATGYSAAADKSPPTWVILTCYMRDWRGHHVSVAGASSRPWARRSPSSSRWAASAPKPVVHDPVPGHRAGYSGVHHPHHHRCHCGRGLGSAGQCRALGRGGQHRLGLDLHDSGERLCRGVAYWVSLY
jgi:hypothetical protein